MASKKQQVRYAVVVTKDTIEEWTLYVSADSPTEASEAAGVVSNCMFPDYEVVHSEYYFDPSPIDPRHSAEPTRLDDTQGMVCAVCLKTVEWTGIAADDPENRSGKTIPGPWEHRP